MNDLTIDDQWRFWGYHYGFRRAIIGDQTEISPIDPHGEWFNGPMAQQAERYYRRMWDSDFDRRYQQPSFAPANVVRDNWREIHSSDMTEAEHALADPLIARMAADAKEAIERAVSRGKKVFSENLSTRRQAREIAPPKGFETAAMSPDVFDDLMRRLETR